jgi:RNA polymerase sigma-70 factor (ECF subfamily)
MERMKADETRAMEAEIRRDPDRFGVFVEQRREALRRMVELRMDPALRARLDASDVVQEACAEAVARLTTWLSDPSMPLHLWLRFITGQKLVQLQRHHLGTDKRSALRDVPLTFGGAPEASAVALANVIAESGVLSPSGVAMREEKFERLHAALASMKAEDREVLVLRHFEQLSNADVAHVLGLSQPGASLRYVRAAKRLREILGELSASGA